METKPISEKGLILTSPYYLAPMAGITDSPFRRLIRSLGAGCVITELVSSAGIVHGTSRTLELMRFAEDERPVGIQLFGEDSAIVAASAKIAESLTPDFIDINLGCPVPKVVRRGGGAALLRDPKQLFNYLKTVRKSISIPLTVKMRTGWDEDSINVIECAKAAEDAGCYWVAIHGRTRAQGYSGEADWELIGRVVQSVSIPVIGNGDVLDAATAIKRQQETNCYGIMIGRGVLRNPWIFQDIMNSQNKPSTCFEKRDFLSILDTHMSFIDETSFGTSKALMTYRKFATFYSHGFPNSGEFRRKIFQFNYKDKNEIILAVREYFSNMDMSLMDQKSKESFFKTGHG